MSFETIIIILQTLGPFTVLVTVYFLVTELREQNRVARANARQNIADSHQKVALAGMKPILVKVKLKLRNNEELTKEENAVYLTYFSVMLRACLFLSKLSLKSLNILRYGALLKLLLQKILLSLWMSKLNKVSYTGKE
jgi:hypothetical protein